MGGPGRPEDGAAGYSPSGMTAQRKYYLFAAAVFTIGAILAVIGGDYTALAIFTVLALMMFWIQSRVDRFVEQRYPSDRQPAGRPSDEPRPRERRPSERRTGDSRPRR